MNNRLRALFARKDAELKAAREITSGLADDQDLTDEQRAKVDAHIATVERLNKDIDREKALEASAIVIPGEGRILGGDPQILKDPKRGFEHFGQFAMALVHAAQPGGNRVVDERLLIGAAVPGSSYANEAVGSDGGFLVPPAFAAAVREYSLEEDALLPLTSNDPVSGNGLKIPVDETTPWGSDGIRAYWEGEAALSTNTKPKLEERELRLRKLFGLVPCSDEILADSTFIASYLPRKLGQSIRYKTNDAIVNGSGTGMPQGFTQSGALVTQTKETGQAADTIVSANVAKMYTRCISPSTAVWLVNPDSFAQVILLTIGDSPAWIPPQGMRESPNGRLLGRPVIMSDTCQTLGDAGDIYFAALGWYQTITKGQGIDFATSMHLWFDYGMTAFRATFRVDGRSVVRNAITPPNSALTRSPFVRMEART